MFNGLINGVLKPLAAWMLPHPTRGGAGILAATVTDAAGTPVVPALPAATVTTHTATGDWQKVAESAGKLVRVCAGANDVDIATAPDAGTYAGGPLARVPAFDWQDFPLAQGVALWIKADAGGAVEPTTAPLT